MHTSLLTAYSPLLAASVTWLSPSAGGLLSPREASRPLLDGHSRVPDNYRPDQNLVGRAMQRLRAPAVAGAFGACRSWLVQPMPGESR